MKRYPPIFKNAYTIYCDMDGVLTNFDESINQTFGMHVDKVFETIPEENIWATINEIDHWWYHMTWQEDGKILWDYIKSYNPILLTTPAPTVQSCKRDKSKWAFEQLGNYNIIFSDKKEKFANYSSILIDDRVDNIDRWIENNGIGILHTTAKNTLKELKGMFL